MVQYWTTLELCSLVVHVITVELYVVEDICTLDITGAVVSGVGSVVKLVWLEVVGPLPDASVDPTLK